MQLSSRSISVTSALLAVLSLTGACQRRAYNSKTSSETGSSAQSSLRFETRNGIRVAISDKAIPFFHYTNDDRAQTNPSQHVNDIFDEYEAHKYNNSADPGMRAMGYGLYVASDPVSTTDYGKIMVMGCFKPGTEFAVGEEVNGEKRKTVPFDVIKNPDFKYISYLYSSSWFRGAPQNQVGHAVVARSRDGIDYASLLGVRFSGGNADNSHLRGVDRNTLCPTVQIIWDSLKANGFREPRFPLHTGAYYGTADTDEKLPLLFARIADMAKYLKENSGGSRSMSQACLSRGSMEQCLNDIFNFQVHGGYPDRMEVPQDLMVAMDAIKGVGLVEASNPAKTFGDLKGDDRARLMEPAVAPADESNRALVESMAGNNINMLVE